MADVETLAERVRTVERAVTDGECEFPDATTLAEIEARVETLEDRIDDLDDRATELDAATQALRGYVGNVRSVNEDVEQRADAAIAATERLEARLDDGLSEADETTSEDSSTAFQQEATPVESPHERPDGYGMGIETATVQQDPGETDDVLGDGDTRMGFQENTEEAPRPDQVAPASATETAEPTEPGLLARIRAHL